jgi:hypothetical protein
MSINRPAPERNSGSPDRSSRGSPERGQTTIDPCDFGDGKEVIFRALELNRRLLYEQEPRARIDRRAFKDKIDELLDRLLATTDVGPPPPRNDAR